MSGVSCMVVKVLASHKDEDGTWHVDSLDILELAFTGEPCEHSMVNPAEALPGTILHVRGSYE